MFDGEKVAAKKLTVERAMLDFEASYRAKKSLIERQKNDFLFRLGKQWDNDKLQKLKMANVVPITDNRIQSNIFLITGLERQNRSDFKAFPEGEEDTLKAEIATNLFKNSIKTSDYQYKASEAFEDGVTCGESHLELYLDNTYNLLNAKPCWKKIDSNFIFPEKGFKEYDYSDARYVNKLCLDLSKDDLIALYPDKKNVINKLTGGKIDFKSFMSSSDEVHTQPKDYAKSNEGRGSSEDFEKEDVHHDLIERYYKKWVDTTFLGDKKTGEIKEAESREKAEAFLESYRSQVQQEQMLAEQMHQQQMQAMVPHVDPATGQPMMAGEPDMNQNIPGIEQPEQATGIPGQTVEPQQPLIQPQDPDRFILIKRSVPEIWCFAFVPGMKEPLADERAWFYPKWKGYPIIPYFAHISNAPLEGEDRHLLVQGIVYGVKGAQQMHNSNETLSMMHLNSSVNSGWLSEEDSWVDPNKVATFGTTPGANLEYKKGRQPPQRISPNPLSVGHETLSERSADSIKSILGINADLLATQEGSSQSGRAIALRQKQGLLMVQKLFDNLSRTKQICGKFLLSQLGELYDTETAKKVLGDAFLQKNFPPPMQFVEDPNTGQPAVDPMTGQPQQEPLKDEKGQPMAYDKELADLTIAEVLSGDLGQYDVSVGESVSSDTMRLANAAELKEIATAMPGLIPPDVLIEESQLDQTTKQRILKSMQAAQAQAQAAMSPPRAVAA
jgi:hypothetical protein